MKKPATSLIVLIMFSGAALLAAACDPYSPDLGREPFLCGTDEPRCPEGYFCDERSETEHVCVQDGTSVPNRPDAMAAPDATPFLCNNDQALEPNNSITMATVTPIPELRDDYPLGNLAVCPTTDVDVYRFRIDETGKNIRVDLSFSAIKGSLLLDILNSAGISIRSGTAVEGDPNLVRAIVENRPADTYYVQVQATPGVENNYSLNIITTGP